MAIQASSPTNLTTKNNPPSPSPQPPASSSRHPKTPKKSRPPSPPPPFNSTSSSSTSAAAAAAGGFRLSSSAATLSTTTTSSSATSLASLRLSLPEAPLIYDFSELRSATNNFLSKPSPSSPSSWHSSLRGKPVIVSQRKLKRSLSIPRLQHLLSLLSSIQLSSIVKLVGASLSSTSDHIYLVYDQVESAAPLSELLRNPRSPNYTVLNTWMSRMQVLTDVAHALDYIHNRTTLNMVLVHNRIDSGKIFITEPNFHARIGDFGAAQLCGDADENSSEIEEESKDVARVLKRGNSGRMQFEGVRGYMSPEYVVNGVATRKSDVYAFGVLLLELLSGEEPVKFRYDRERGDFVRTAVVDTARTVAAAEGRGSIRGWVDKRLGDSFPEEVAEKVVRLGLECVEEDPDLRADMGRVAGKVSKLFVQSESWAKRFKMPTEISVSLSPR